MKKIIFNSKLIFLLKKLILFLKHQNYRKDIFIAFNINYNKIKIIILYIQAFII